MKEFVTKIHVIYCDSDVVNVEVFTREDLPLDLHPRGGGGTDFRPVFEWIEENGMDPACMVYLTDLCCTLYPDEPPHNLLTTAYSLKIALSLGGAIFLPRE